MVHDLARGALLMAFALSSVACDRPLTAQGAREPAATSAGSAGPPAAGEGAPAARASAASPAAVIELFTSEGCSSCPPADAVLTTLAEEAPSESVVTLSFHVDYWNELGWHDPWSSPAHTARQEQYARALGGRGLYTPQMVVNGRDAFVGSDAAHARESVESLRGRRLPVALEGGVRAGGSGVSVSVRARPMPSRAVLHVAAAEPRVVSQVARGENGGRTLHHTNVVRAFRTVVLDASEVEVALGLPRDLPAQRALIVAYLQHPRTMEVLGATTVSGAP
jgi:hypothetical protein